MAASSLTSASMVAMNKSNFNNCGALSDKRAKIRNINSDDLGAASELTRMFDDPMKQIYKTKFTPAIRDIRVSTTAVERIENIFGLNGKISSIVVTEKGIMYIELKRGTSARLTENLKTANL